MCEGSPENMHVLPLWLFAEKRSELSVFTCLINILREGPIVHKFWRMCPLRDVLRVGVSFQLFFGTSYLPFILEFKFS
jgi:hypothetical protein